MKNLLIILFVGVVSVTNAQNNFRDTEWGMSAEKVKQSEDGDPALENEESIGYFGSVASLDVIIAYYFVENKLYKGAYIFNEDHTNKNLYLEDYLEIKEILTEKYGEPLRSEVEWNDDLYKDDVSEYGLAVSIGHLKMFSIWSLDDIVIEHRIEGDNYEIRHNVVYTSVKYGRIANQKLQEEEQDAF